MKYSLSWAKSSKSNDPPLNFIFPPGWCILEAALKPWQKLKHYQQNAISLTVSILGLSRCCIKFQSFSHILNWFLVSVAWATRIQATRLPSGSSSKSPLAWIMNIYQVFSVKNWHHDIDWLSGEHYNILCTMDYYWSCRRVKRVVFLNRKPCEHFFALSI